jgi:competence protein ComEC
MPLITLAALFLISGLFVGFAGVSLLLTAAVVAAVLLLGSALGRREAGDVALLLLLVTGVALAHSSMRNSAACRRAIIEAANWTVELLEDAAPGSFVRGRIRHERCSVAASISVRSGVAPAGASVDVTGQVAPGSGGVMLQRARIEERGKASLLWRWRAAARRSVDFTFGDDAPLARALLVADSRGISPDLRERYASAGIAHLLAISGLHVGIIYMSVVLLFRVVRMHPRAAELAALVVTVVYVGVIGAPPAALRAATMLIAYAASRLFQRPTSPWAALAIGALAPLYSPDIVLSLSYQLSLTGMAGVIAGGALAQRLLHTRVSGWRYDILAGMVVTVIASIATAPIIAWTFGRVSIVAPLVNVVAGPVIGLLQPMMFLALALGPIPPAAGFVADAAHPLLRMLDAIASIGSEVPFASVGAAPTLTGAFLSGIAAAAIVIACVSRFPARATAIAGLAVTVLAWLPLLPSAPGPLEVHMLDVGQGDAIAIRTPPGRWILVDAGRDWAGGDAGRRTIVPYVRRRGGRVHGFILSHPHSDHVGGAASAVEALKPAVYWDGAFVTDNQSYLASLEMARASRTRWSRVRPGEVVLVDGVTLRFLAPDSAWAVSLNDPNEASTVVRVEYGNVRLLLTGDAESAAESWLLANARPALQAEILKVGHHGSSTSTGEKFLEAVSPRVALISVGAGNMYGHPSTKVLESLAASGAVVLRTDIHGSVVVATDGREIVLHALGERWSLSGSR